MIQPTLDELYAGDLALLLREPKSSVIITSSSYNVEEVCDLYFNMDFIYSLTEIEIRDFNPIRFHSFRPFTLFEYVPDQRPLFEALTGKRALGLSPPC
jgi:hypothetical protein